MKQFMRDLWSHLSLSLHLLMRKKTDNIKNLLIIYDSLFVTKFIL